MRFDRDPDTLGTDRSTVLLRVAFRNFRVDIKAFAQ